MSIAIADIEKFLDGVRSIPGPKRPPVMLVGGTGLGKTEAIVQYANMREMNIKIAHAVLWEPVDVQGVPYVDTERGMAWFAPFQDLWPWGPNSILFLDELNRASIPTLNALLRVVLERRVGSHELPRDLMVIAAVNPPGGGSHVTPLSSAMAARWTIVNVEATVDGWISWAAANGINHEVISFITKRRNMLVQDDDSAGERLEAAPNPRAWARVSDILHSELNNGLLEPAVVGTVGKGAATEFLAWRDIADRLPDPKAILDGTADIPPQPDAGIATAVSVTSYVIEAAQRADDAEVAGEMFVQLFNRQIESGWPAEYITLSIMMLQKARNDGLAYAIQRSGEWRSKFGAKFYLRNN